MIATRAVLLVAVVACGRVESNPSSSGPDAASPDTPGTDASCPGFFCSGFEPEEPGTTWATALESGAVVEVVSQAAIAPHGGTHALHVILARGTGNPPTQAAMYHTLTASPYKSGELYARAWFQVPASNTGIVKNHVDMFTLGSAGHGGEEITLFLPGEQPDGQLLAWLDPTGSPDGITIQPPSPIIIPTGSWFCVVLHVAIGLNGSLEFGVNQTRSGSQPARTQLNDGTDTIGVGLVYVDPAMSAGTSELYIDDVAVSMLPLSCP